MTCWSERCGFVEEGRMRQAIYRDGRYLDMIVMSLLKEDWPDTVTI